MNHNKIEHYKNAYPKGTRIKLNCMAEESDMPKGLEVSVVLMDDAGQIHVDWDNGRGLALIPGVDSF